MRGINAATGQQLEGLAHLRQSLTDILTTRIGSRVQRRDYGSRLFELLDAPLNRATLVELYAATAEAVARWEPRFALQRVTADQPEPGSIYLTLIGEYLPDGQQITIDGIQVT